MKFNLFLRCVFCFSSLLFSLFILLRFFSRSHILSISVIFVHSFSSRIGAVCTLLALTFTFYDKLILILSQRSNGLESIVRYLLSLIFFHCFRSSVVCCVHLCFYLQTIRLVSYSFMQFYLNELEQSLWLFAAAAAAKTTKKRQTIWNFCQLEL